MVSAPCVKSCFLTSGNEGHTYTTLKELTAYKATNSAYAINQNLHCCRITLFKMFRNEGSTSYLRSGLA